MKRVEKIVKLLKGGPGSGNFGHAGRPGEVGGSGKGEGDAAAPRRGGHARAGGEIGVNGFEYKGGQFLPSSETTVPGEHRREKPVGGMGKEQTGPYKWEVPPSPMHRSLYSVLLVGVLTKKGMGGKLLVNDKYSPSWNDYKPITGDIDVDFSVRNGPKMSYKLNELLDFYNNKGIVWVSTVEEK